MWHKYALTFLVVKLTTGGKKQRWRIVDIPTAQQWLSTLKKEDQRTSKAPTGSHKQQEAKPSPNLQIEKQITTGRMGRTTHSSTPPPIPCHWSCCMALGSRLHYWVLVWQYILLPGTHINSELHVPHTTGPATFTLKCQGNQCPYVSRTQGSHCYTGNRKCKPASSVSAEATKQNCRTLLSEANMGNQVPELLLLTGLVLWSLKQSHWTALSETHAGNQEPATTHISKPHALLFCWFQETSLPRGHGGPTLPTVSRRFSHPLQRARKPDSLRGGKLQPATLQAAPEALFPPPHTHTEAQQFIPTSLQKSHFSPVQELESQILQ
jgi:hypothetical protein